MRSLTLTLKINFETVSNMVYATLDLERAIQNRLFGEGVFDAGTLVDTWSSEIEIQDTPKPLKKVKIRMTCDCCKSTDVRIDAWAFWDEKNQDWRLAETYENPFCMECEGPCRIDENEIPKPSCPDNCEDKS